jgi:hypothetical protein
MGSRPVADELAEMLGMSRLLAPGLVRRALTDAGADARTATLEDYRRCLTYLKRRLLTYLPPEAAEERLKAVESWLSGRDRAV